MDEHVEAVQRMQDYIEAHLDENITMANLANVSLYSPWHSYRLFVDLLHMTPAVYIRRLRLSKSALRLRDEKVKIIDIAYNGKVFMSLNILFIYHSDHRVVFNN